MAVGVGRTVVQERAHALIHIATRHAVTGVAHIAGTREAPKRVGARGESMAIVGVSRTLVDVVAHGSSPGVAKIARAAKRAIRVRAQRIVIASVVRTIRCYQRTLIDVIAHDTVTRIALATRTRKTSSTVGAHGVGIAVVESRTGAVGNVSARRSRCAVPSGITRTRKRSVGIGA